MINVIRNLLLLGASGIQPITYLFRDLFNTDRAAGAVNGTAAEPGPGNRQVSDANSVISITGGQLSVNGTPVITSGNYAGPYARRVGRALKFKVPVKTTPASIGVCWGIGNPAASTGQPLNSNDNIGLQLATTTNVNVRSNFNAPVASWAAGLSGSTHEHALVLRQNGGFVLTSNAEDSFYSLLWVWRSDLLDTMANLWAKIQPSAATAHVVALDDIEIVDLAGPLASEYGAATDRKAVVAANDTINANADGIIEFTWTPGTGETLDIQVRRTDDNNCIIVRCSQSGSTIVSYSKSSGTETQLASSAQTWTAGTTYRITLRLNANAIRPYVDMTFKHTAVSTFNQTATGTKVILAGLELVSWPATIAKSIIVAGMQRPNDFTGLEFLAEIAVAQSALTSGNYNVVYLGGSITNGTASSDHESTSWRARMSAYINTRWPSATFTHINSGVGGTPSWYGLVRRATDVTTYSPRIIFVDFAVNDSTNAWDQPAAEALIRLLRSTHPNAIIIGMFGKQVADYTTDVTTNVKDPVKQWWKKLFVAYRIPWFDYDNALTALVLAGGHINTYQNDNVHPNDTGHAILYNGLAPLVSATTAYDTNDIAYPWATHLAILPRMHANTSLYENTPTIQNGTSGALAGTWTTINTTAKTSSTANSTIAFTATCHSFGLDSNVSTGAGIVAWSIDGGAYTNIDLSVYLATNQPVTSFARGSHTITLKVISGTVQINRFLAI